MEMTQIPINRLFNWWYNTETLKDWDKSIYNNIIPFLLENNFQNHIW